VAEEVGNLASMSGKAALEIAEMLDNSIKRVKDIVDNTQKKIENLVSTSKGKVEAGTKTAHDCGDSLDEILQNVNSVNEMVRDIASASGEQSTGVQEVTKAMQELDQTTHQNTSVAQKTSSMSRKLESQATDLASAVSELIGIVSGNQNSSSYSKPQSPQGEQDQTHQNVVPLPRREQKDLQVKSTLKVSGMDTEIPDASDPRFEEL